MTTRQRLAWLHPGAQDEPFPPLEQALTEPNGLLAAGGDLALPRLLEAYRQGIFPWFEAGQPILWWSPDPRAVLFIERLNIGRSLRKSLRKRRYRVSFDSAFNQVVKACAAPRRGASGTWITYGMYVAYTQLFEQGHAHSVEVWEDDHLVGGLYGVAVGRLFCGESMFTRAPDASKIALVTLACHLAHWGFPLIDSQTSTPHMLHLGAELIPRALYRELLDDLCQLPGLPDPWRVDPDLDVIEWKPGATSSPT